MMRWGEVGWVLFLAGLPFSHFLNRSLNIWHGHALYAQSCLLVLWAASFTVSKATKPNWPLACWVLWVGSLTLWLWTNGIIQSKTYPLPILLGAIHVVFLLMFYHAAMTHWTIQTFDTLFLWMARVGVLVLAYCGLQLLNLDQFFNYVDTSKSRDVLVGTMGNPSHLGSYLACLVPLLLFRHGKRWLGIFLGCAGLLIFLLLTEKTVGGPLAAVGAVLWCCWHWARKWFWASLGVVGLLGLWALTRTNILNDSGRWAAWGAFYDVFQHKPILGLGLGFISELSHQITSPSHPLFQWRHVHNEFFQIAIEQGVIGLSLVAWILVDYWRTVWRLPKTREVVACAGIMLAFLLNSLVNFPAHLWAIGSFGLLSYCGIKVIEADTCPS